MSHMQFMHAPVTHTHNEQQLVALLLLLLLIDLGEVDIDMGHMADYIDIHVHAKIMLLYTRNKLQRTKQ